MSLPEPTTLTVSGVAKTLNRISTGDNRSIYRNSDGSITLTASHSYAKRNRSVVRVDFQKTGADPLFPAQNLTVLGSTYVVLDRPKIGFTNAELVGYLEALADLLKVVDYSEKFVEGQN